MSIGHCTKPEVDGSKGGIIGGNPGCLPLDLTHLNSSSQSEKLLVVLTCVSVMSLSSI